MATTVDACEELLRAQRFEDLFRLSRFLYNVGEEGITDEVYDLLVEYCKEENVMQDYLNRLYEDDPIPYDLLEGVELAGSDILNDSFNEYIEELQVEESLSIEPIFDYDAAWEWCRNLTGEDIVMSLKVDGVFWKALVNQGKLLAACSRGRHQAAVYDYTYAIQQATPKTIPVQDELRIFGESYVQEDYLEGLREKYPNKKFIGPKFASNSLSRVKYKPEDYEGYRCLVHGMSGYGKTLEEQYRFAKELGYDVVPYILIKANEIPTSKFEFIEWLRGKLDFFWDNYKHVPSDGVVLAVNNLSFVGQINGIYSTNNLALKLEYWNNKLLCGKVTDIWIEQRRVFASCRVTIEPMKLYDGSEARVINTFNPRKLIDANIHVGSRVYYERTSNAINVLSKTGMVKIEE